MGKLHCFFDPRDILTGPINYRSSHRDTVILEYFNMKKYTFYDFDITIVCGSRKVTSVYENIVEKNPY